MSPSSTSACRCSTASRRRGRSSGDCRPLNVLILSMHANEAYIIQALKAGAHGYLLEGFRGHRVDSRASPRSRPVSRTSARRSRK